MKISKETRRRAAFILELSGNSYLYDIDDNNGDYLTCVEVQRGMGWSIRSLAVALALNAWSAVSDAASRNAYEGEQFHKLEAAARLREGWTP